MKGDLSVCVMVQMFYIFNGYMCEVYMCKFVRQSKDIKYLINHKQYNYSVSLSEMLVL